MKVVAVVLVAGKSTRFGADVSKQVFLLGGKPVFSFPVDAFAKSKLIDEVCVVTDETNESQIKDYIEKSGYKNVNVILGGETRQESVRNGLNSLKKYDNNDFIIIHDGARPLVDEEIIERTINEVKKYDAVTTYVSCEDTMAVSDGGNSIIEFIDRRKLVRIQTPQAFNLGLLREAHSSARNDLATDDCSLVMGIPHQVKLIEGSKKLTKLTTIEDVKILENYLKWQNTK